MVAQSATLVVVLRRDLVVSMEGAVLGVMDVAGAVETALNKRKYVRQ